MKKFFILIVIFAVGFILVTELLKNTDITSSTKEPNVVVDKKVITVEVAGDPLSQIKGLSGHAKLENSQGMLFVFSDKQVRTFWMKDMLFPIDIVWIEDNKIVKIDRDLAPEGDYPSKTYNSVSPINYVLEINAGVADKNNFKIGDRVKYNL